MAVEGAIEPGDRALELLERGRTNRLYANRPVELRVDIAVAQPPVASQLGDQLVTLRAQAHPAFKERLASRFCGTIRGPIIEAIGKRAVQTLPAQPDPQFGLDARGMVAKALLSRDVEPARRRLTARDRVA